MKSTLSIGEVAQAVGVRTSTVRYYEEVGVLPRPERQSGRRVYGPDAIRRLERIQLAQASGFSLDEIRKLMAVLELEREGPARWRRLAEEKLREVDAQIARLEAMKQLLHEATRCDCGSLRRCPLVAQRPPRGKPLAKGRLRRF